MALQDPAAKNGSTACSPPVPVSTSRADSTSAPPVDGSFGGPHQGLPLGEAGKNLDAIAKPLVMSENRQGTSTTYGNAQPGCHPTSDDAAYADHVVPSAAGPACAQQATIARCKGRQRLSEAGTGAMREGGLADQLAGRKFQIGRYYLERGYPPAIRASASPSRRPGRGLTGADFVEALARTGIRS